MRTLAIVWVALMVLLAATTGSALVPLGTANTLLNLVIAIAKTALVALFFMHLRHSISLLRLIAIVGLTTLSLLFILSGADFVTRSIERSAWQTPPGVGTGDQSAATPSEGNPL
ncbi:Caa(3)-type oxidase subunit IV [Parapusillimonas sp. SGNA-6]|nr:Caa(3)-type oxidase subunit IV [Parapusillimonas sp. SGNA-6]